MSTLNSRGAFILSLSLSLLSRQCVCERTNMCNMTDNMDSDNEYIWYSTTDFVPLDGISCGHMYLGHINFVEFDFVWHGRTTSDEAEMFFRVGFDSWYGSTCDGQNSNYPSLWISPDDDYLMLGVSDSASCSHRYILDDYDDVEEEVSHHVLIYFDDEELTVDITGGGKDDYQRSWNKTRPKLAHIGSVVPVWWMSTKFGGTEYNRANGTFSDIVITSRQFENSTLEPTMPIECFCTTIVHVVSKQKEAVPKCYLAARGLPKCLDLVRPSNMLGQLQMNHKQWTT